MTTLTKDEVLKLARKAGGLPDPMVFIAAYERFAHLCRADLEKQHVERLLRIGTEVAKGEQPADWRAPLLDAISKRCAGMQPVEHPKTVPLTDEQVISFAWQVLNRGSTDDSIKQRLIAFKAAHGITAQGEQKGNV